METSRAVDGLGSLVTGGGTSRHVEGGGASAGARASARPAKLFLAGNRLPPPTAGQALSVPPLRPRTSASAARAAAGVALPQLRGGGGRSCAGADEIGRRCIPRWRAPAKAAAATIMAAPRMRSGGACKGNWRAGGGGGQPRCRSGPCRPPPLACLHVCTRCTRHVTLFTFPCGARGPPSRTCTDRASLYLSRSRASVAPPHTVQLRRVLSWEVLPRRGLHPGKQHVPHRSVGPLARPAAL